MFKKIYLVSLIGLLLTACASQQPYYGYNTYGNGYGYNSGYGNNSYGYRNGGSRVNKALIGGGVGAVAGAALGTAFGGDDLANAGIGALAGGAVGAAVGAYVDHQQQRRDQRQQYGYQQDADYGGYYQ